ncbi:16896_t:CDS:1, partial [Funneliformis caledonium]
MAMIEEIKTELNKAEVRLDEATKNLEIFMKKENLEKFEKRWETEAMKEEKKLLKAEKKRWGDE